MTTSHPRLNPPKVCLIPARYIFSLPSVEDPSILITEVKMVPSALASHSGWRIFISCKSGHIPNE